MKRTLSVLTGEMLIARHNPFFFQWRTPAGETIDNPKAALRQAKGLPAAYYVTPEVDGEAIAFRLRRAAYSFDAPAFQLTRTRGQAPEPVFFEESAGALTLRPLRRLEKWQASKWRHAVKPPQPPEDPAAKEAERARLEARDREDAQLEKQAERNRKAAKQAAEQAERQAAQQAHKRKVEKHRELWMASWARGLASWAHGVDAQRGRAVRDDLLLEARADGLTYNELSEIYGLTPGGIVNILRKHKAKPLDNRFTNNNREAITMSELDNTAQEATLTPEQGEGLAPPPAPPDEPNGGNEGNGGAAEPQYEEGRQYPEYRYDARDLNEAERAYYGLDDDESDDEDEPDNDEPDNDAVFPNIQVQLVGRDDHAFSILGRCQKAMRRAKVPKGMIAIFMDEARSGDYNNLLATCCKWLDCH